jgi:hypothetical protein
MMPLELARAVIENAAAEGFDSVALGGGEPLTALSRTMAVAEIASRMGLTVAVTTSGYGLTEKTLRKLEESRVDHIQFSLGAYRTNVATAYRLLVKERRRCSFGANLLLSPHLVPYLPRLVNRLDSDGSSQVTLLLPKGSNVPRFSRDEFMRYYSALKTLKPKNITILVDCATEQILKGKCESEGCSFFPDGTVSRCAFGCGERKPWNGSLKETIADDPHQCNEGLAILASRIDS